MGNGSSLDIAEIKWTWRAVGDCSGTVFAQAACDKWWTNQKDVTDYELVDGQGSSPSDKRGTLRLEEGLSCADDKAWSKLQFNPSGTQNPRVREKQKIESNTMVHKALLDGCLCVRMKVCTESGSDCVAPYPSTDCKEEYGRRRNLNEAMKLCVSNNDCKHASLRNSALLSNCFPVSLKASHGEGDVHVDFAFDSGDGLQEASASIRTDGAHAETDSIVWIHEAKDECRENEQIVYADIANYEKMLVGIGNLN